MLALVGYIGGAWRGLVDLARRNPALKWALIALGVVFAVEVVAEVGLKVYREAVAAYVEGSTAQNKVEQTAAEKQKAEAQAAGAKMAVYLHDCPMNWESPDCEKYKPAPESAEHKAKRSELLPNGEKCPPGTFAKFGHCLKPN